MSGAFLLFRLSLKRVRLLLCATGLVARGRPGLAGAHRGRWCITPGNSTSSAALLPPSVRDILGPSLASIMSFNGIVCGVYFDTGFIIALLALAIALATLPASEIETGFADLILARPLPRHWLITRTIALVLFSILLMLLMIMAGTWAGLALFAPPDAPWPSARQTGSLALSLGMLVASWGGDCHGLRRRLPPRRGGRDHGPARLRRVAPGLGSPAVAGPRLHRLAVAVLLLQPV